MFTFVWLGKLAIWTYAPPMLFGFSAVALLGLSGFDDEAQQLNELKDELERVLGRDAPALGRRTFDGRRTLTTAPPHLGR